MSGEITPRHGEMVGIVSFGGTGCRRVNEEITPS